MDEEQKLLTEIEQEIIRGESIEGATAANVQRKRFNALFRATSTKDLGTFHTICDGKGPTLTVLHGRYNVWFGGYTSKNWSKGKNNPVEDSHAFLFHKFDNTKDPCKFFPIKKKKVYRAIICDDNFGPTFGGKSGKDYDLQTFNLAGKNESVTKDDGYMLLNGSINFGMAYKGEGPLPKNAINGGTMEIKLIEIYSVVDGTPDNMWREKPSDDDVKEMKDEILTLIPLQGLNIQAYNILLVGVINAGKSSFCNTLLSEFADKIKFDVATGSEVNSVTNKVQQCRLSYKQQRTLCVNIIDIRGYDKQRSYEHELQHLLDGKLKKDYEFPDEAVEISEDELLKDPELNDQVHLVCFVVSGEKISAQEQDKNLISKLVQIKKTVRDRNIPIAAVVSKLDLKCPSIKYDADNVYTSPIAADTIKKVAEVLGMEVKDVFPIVNYVNDKELVPAKRRLVIKALHSMVHLAENCLEKYIQFQMISMGDSNVEFGDMPGFQNTNGVTGRCTNGYQRTSISQLYD